MRNFGQFNDDKDQSTAIEVEIGTRIERLEDMEQMRQSDAISNPEEIEVEEPGWYVWISYCMLFYYGITFVLGLVFLVLALAFAPSAKYIISIDVLWCVFQILLWNNAVNAINETEKSKFDWVLFLLRVDFLILLIPGVLDYTFKTSDYIELAKLCALDPILYQVLENSDKASSILSIIILVVIPGYFYIKTVLFKKTL